MAKGSALVTVGLAVGAAWYLRNVAFPGTSSLLPARFADASRRASRPLRGGVELPKRRRSVAPERVVRNG